MDSDFRGIYCDEDDAVYYMDVDDFDVYYVDDDADDTDAAAYYVDDDDYLENEAIMQCISEDENQECISEDENQECISEDENQEYFSVGEVTSDDEDDNEELEIAFVDKKNFIPRSYQEELFEYARDRNSILVLGTGSGKTFISILLIKELASSIRGTLEDGAKRTVFVVNTVPLVYQQKEAIERHTGFVVGHFEGSLGVDSWSEEKWHEELNKNEVLVMVAQIFKDLILHNRLPLGNVNLIIMDECHHATGNHPMREIMREYNNLRKSELEVPRVMGLTACVIHKACKERDVVKYMKSLENVMDSSLVTSVDQDEVKKFTTRPQEVNIVCQSKTFSTNSTNIIERLNEIENTVKEHVQRLYVLESGLKEKMVKFVGKQIRSIIEVSVDLGEYILPKAIEFQAEYLLEAETDTSYEQDILNMLGNKLKDFHKNYTSEIECDPKKGISGKVERLIEILRQPSEVERVILVFVTRRNTCKLLCSLLYELKNHYHGLDYLLPECIVGGTTNMKDDLKIREEIKKQKIILNNFRKGVCNLIVSTSVLEEGIDVRKCNIVIRYDSCANFRSYVQSLGRARAIPSYFITLTGESEKENVIENIRCFKRVQRELNTMCHGRELPEVSESCKDFEEDEVEPPYAPYGVPGPQITFNSAIQLVNKYCGTLPQDKFTKLSVSVEKKRNKGKYYVTLQLPTSSPLRTKINSKMMDNWDDAKKSAALEMCKELFRLNLLDKHLLPKKTRDTAMESLNRYLQIQEESVLGNEPKQGTKKRRQIYKRRICNAFKNEHHTYHLYMICFQHLLSFRSGVILDTDIQSTNLGIICAEKLNCCAFPLYSKKWGEVNIIVEYVNEISCNERIIQDMKDFHRIISQYVLKLDFNMMCYDHVKSGHALFTVPLKKNKNLDVNQMSALSNFATENCSNPGNKAKSLKRDFEFKLEQFENGVIYPSYRDIEIYQVLKVLHGETPMSPFHDSKKKYISYRDYVNSVYSVDILNKDQPLIECKHFSKEYNYLEEVHQEEKETNSLHPKFIPELCNVLPVTAPFFCQMLCFPSILHRINGLQIEQEIYESVGYRADVREEEKFRHSQLDYKWAEVAVQNVMSNSKVNLVVKLCKKTKMSVYPGMILQALTPLHSRDNFNLERLEVLGDSYLKYSIGAYLFCKETISHEGKLTIQRSEMVSNKTLYHLAKKKGLADSMQYVKLSSHNGVPYGFHILEHVERTLKGKKIPPQKWCHNLKDGVTTSDEVGEISYNPWTEQMIPDKSIADCTEALIGVYLLCGGENGAKHFMEWLGYSIMKEVVTFPTTAVMGDILSETELWKKVRVLYYKNCLDRLEQILKYTFKEKSFLIQAVTHPSYLLNKVTDCYQRLEFLGDSVLDFLVTGHIYSNFSEFTPGQLTDLRSHYVNNETLARIAVKFGLNKFLLHQSSKLSCSIEAFIKLVEDGERELNTESDTTDVTDVEVPKALGDLVESLIGAVFVDSGKSLEVTWRMIERFLEDEFKATKEKIPIDCVRELYEKVPQFKLILTNPTENEQAKCVLQMEGYGDVIGRGKNKRTAKQNAAKNALRIIKQNEK